jgi:hypothetical protein
MLCLFFFLRAAVTRLLLIVRHGGRILPRRLLLNELGGTTQTLVQHTQACARLLRHARRIDQLRYSGAVFGDKLTL